jgi:hypothetical protein
MDFTNWVVQNLQSWQYLRIDTWGITPLQLAAPLALLTLIFMCRRFSQTAGPKTESRDLGGVALVTVIVGAAFLWILAGMHLLQRNFQ